MKTRSLIATVTVLFLSSMACLVACATDEDPSMDPGADPNKLPGPDSGPDVAPGDTGVDTDPCVPDALCPNGPFRTSSGGPGLDPRTRINVIRGRSISDVWAVGARGAVAHFDGTEWKLSETGNTETISSLWLRDPGEIALASAAYTRGLPSEADAGAPSSGGWTAAALANPAEKSSEWRITSAWMTPSAEWLWCTTLEFPSQSPFNGLWRIHLDPSTHALEAGGAGPRNMCAVLGCTQMMGIHGASADDLWAVGLKGATIHITEAQSDTPIVKAFDSQTWAGLEGVWVASENDAWAVGGAGTIRHYTGSPVSWDVVPDVPTTETLRAIWGTSSTDVWAVGDHAVVLHYDGTRWSLVKVAGLGPLRPDLYTVWTPAPGHVWAGGDSVILSLGGKP